MPKGIQQMTAGWSTWRWLSGVNQKEKSWLLGTIQGRGGFEAWMTHLTRGLQDSDFFLRFEQATDPWQRSKIVGEKIAELTKTFKALTPEQRLELSKNAETELRTGLELLGKDKKTIQELIAIVDPPAAH